MKVNTKGYLGTQYFKVAFIESYCYKITIENKCKMR